VTGTAFHHAVVELVTGGETPAAYVKWEFEDVVVSLYNTSHYEGGLAPMEVIALDYRKVTYNYRRQRPDGTFDAWLWYWWDRDLQAGGGNLTIPGGGAAGFEFVTSYHYEPDGIPEPATVALVVGALAVAAACGWRSRGSRQAAQRPERGVSS
jgi:hypothetical protein